MIRLFLFAAGLGLACLGPLSALAQSDAPPTGTAADRQKLSHELRPSPPTPSELDEVPAHTRYGLDELVALALAQHPQLAQAGYDVENARGRGLQESLYPNPKIEFLFDELGDRTGPQGVNTLPAITQEIITGGKRKLSREASQKEINRASWEAVGRRYELLGELRGAYFETLALQTKIEVIRRQVELADNSVDRARELLENKLSSRLELVQLEIEVEQTHADYESAQRELPGSYRKLAALVGMPSLDIERVTGTLATPLPEYSIALVEAAVLASHPDVQAARAGWEKARVDLRRAQVEPIPNVSVETGYIRQNQNRSDDFRIGASFIVPLWDRNQGAIRAAEADLCKATQEIRVAENDLTQQVAKAMQSYASARQRSLRYQSAILPRAHEAYRLARAAYDADDIEYLQVLDAQRTLGEAGVEYIRALGEAWEAAATVSGLLMEEHWPPLPPPAQVPPAPSPAP